jgi:hypothetical protein
VQRGKYNTVTSDFRLPVLIATTPDQQEGLATFDQEVIPPRPVRTLKDSDLKNANKYLTESDARHFGAVVALAQALRNPSDSIALEKARGALEKAYESRRAEPTFGNPPSLEFAEGLSRWSGLPPEEALEVWERKRPGPRAAADPRWLLSYEVSCGLFFFARLVLWWTGDRFTPAIMCEDIKTAFYVRALLSAVRGKGLHICPHCNDPFLQQRPDQNYCSIAHREAHRVARWRAVKAKKSKEKGPRHGSRKAR